MPIPPTDRPARSQVSVDPHQRPGCLGAYDVTPPEDHSSLAELIRAVFHFLTGATQDTTQESDRGRDRHGHQAAGHHPRSRLGNQLDTTIMSARGESSPALFRAHRAVAAARNQADRTARAQRLPRWSGRERVVTDAQDAVALVHEL